MTALERTFLFVLLLCVLRKTVCVLSVPTCSNRTYCPGGSVNQVISSSNVSQTLSELSEAFCGCQTVDSSIDLAFPTEDNTSLVENDFNFLYYLKEITGFLRISNLPSTPRFHLPNLILIRGREQTESGNSLEISDSRADSIFFPNLREVNGNVTIHNSSWCGYTSVNWEDILENGQLVVSGNDTTCIRQNCTGCDDDYCWEPQECQMLTKVGKAAPTQSCNGQRYFFSPQDNRTFCCDQDCAAGCTGLAEMDCLFCKQFSIDGECVSQCPPEFILDMNDVEVRNPDYRVQAGSLCLVQCPVGSFDQVGKCVSGCSDGFFAEGGRCVRCIGTCPSGDTCSGWPGLDAVQNNTDPIMTTFLNQECAIVNGNIRITEETVTAYQMGRITLQNLQRFEHVRVIRGVLQLQGWDSSLPPLEFFRNVEYIGTSNLSSSSSSNSSLGIFNLTGIDRINLSNLRQILFGNVEITMNSELCYVGDFQTNLTSVYLAIQGEQSLITGPNPFRSVQECMNKTCHPECVEERRCWGPNDTNCVLCTNYRYEQEWKCVPDCSLDNDTYQDDTLTSRSYKYCASCDEECIECTGAGPFLCKRCRNFEINFSNGSRKCVPECDLGYYTVDMECRQCDALCVGGCSGPGNHVGSGGCASCRVVLFDSNNQQIGCVDSVCPFGSYIELLRAAIGPVPEQNQACFPCHENCLSCVGPNNTDCLQCSFGSRSNGTTMVNGMNTLTCVTSEDVSPNFTPSIVGGVFGALGLFIILMILLVLVFLLYRRLCRKSPHKHEEEVIGIHNDLYGTLSDIEEQVLPVPKVNLHAFLTPVDSLQFEEQLGSGAFGTVHKGLWQPPGEGFQYTVAIKVLNDDTPSNATQELLDEGVAMASMDHPYIVRLYAMCMGENLMLVTQFLPMGSLLHFLRKYKDDLNAYHLLTYGQQIAEGMAYLEEQRMVHRDLAARNVLVQTSSKVKIADFGLSKCLEVGESGYKAGKGKVPVRWLAPESLRKREFSHKSDVWAYGVTMWEVLTFGAKPYGKKKAQEVLLAIEKGERLPQPATSSIELYATLLKCWLNNPDSRPSFNTLSDTFRPWCSDPLRYVSTTRDGALVSYTDLPTNEAEEEECDYECVDVLLKSQDPSTNSTVLRNSHSVDDVEDDYHMLADTAQGYEDPLGVKNEEIGSDTKDTQDQPPEYNEIDEINFNDDDHNGGDGYHMLSEGINGYEDPIVTDGKTQDDNDSYHMLSEAINGYEDPVVVDEKSQEVDDGYMVVDDDEDDNLNGYVEIDEDENGKATLVPKSSIYQDEEASDTVLFNPNT